MLVLSQCFLLKAGDLRYFFCYICDRQNSNAKHCMKTNPHKMPWTINSILQTNSEISIDFCNLITYFAEYSVFRLKYSMEKQHKKPQVHSEEYENLQFLIITILSYFANSVSSTTFWDTCADPDVFPGGWRVCEIFLFARKFRGPFW